MTTSVLNRVYWEYKEWVFSITETIEQNYDIALDNSLLKLKEIKAEIEKIPVQIENMEKRKLELIKWYNDWVEVLNKAKETYNWEWVEIPEAI